MPKQEIILPGVSNARELGGYTVGDRRIRKGVLLRSGALTHATPEALETLRDKYRVQTVADLRMTMERNTHPDPEIPGAENLHLPALEIDEFQASIPPELLQEYADGRRDSLALFNAAYKNGMFDEELYTRALLRERAKKTWKDFFGALLALEEDRAFLWHCVDGKDRAGKLLRRVIHRHSRAGNAPRARRLRDKGLRHVAARLAAERPERRFVDSGERHVGVRDDHGAAQRRKRAPDRVRREAQAFRVIEIRRRVDHAPNHRSDVPRQRDAPRGELAVNDAHTLTFDFRRLDKFHQAYSSIAR